MREYTNILKWNFYLAIHYGQIIFEKSTTFLF